MHKRLVVWTAVLCFVTSLFVLGATAKSNINSLHALAHSASAESADNPAMLPLAKNNSASKKGRRADRVIATKVIKGMDELPKVGNLASAAR